MFGIGFFELLIIAIVALVFVGPKRLPEVMRQAGKFFVQIRRTTNDVRATFDQVVRDAEAEIRREEAAQMKALLQSAEPPKSPSTAASTPASHTDLQHDHHHHHHHHHEHATTPAGVKPYEPSQAAQGAPVGLTEDAKWHPIADAPAHPTEAGEAAPDKSSKPNANTPKES